MVAVWHGWKLCKQVLTSLLVIYLVLLAAVQICQRVTRRRAERLLSDLRGLQLEKSSWSDAQALMQHWGRWGGYRGSCDANHCEYGIHFDSAAMVPMPSKIPESLAAFLIRPVEMATWALHARRSYVEAGFRVQNNSVVGTWLLLVTSVNGGGWMASRATGTRTRNLEPYKLWPEKDPHPEYRTGLRSGTNGAFFTQFTAATKPEDVEWLTAFNFSCMTRWVPCTEMGGLLPAAWAKYTAESRRISAIQERIGICAYPLEELVKASEHVALVQVEEPNAQKRQWSPYRARLVKSLKGSSSWHSGDARVIWSGQDPIAPAEIVLFADDSNPVSPHDCGVIPTTPENLRTVRAAVEGNP